MGNASKATILTALILLPMAAAGAQAPQMPSPPVGADSQGLFFVNYPSRSLDDNEDGSVGYQLNVDKKGLPLDCVVTQSSGHKRLDQITCMAAVHHARFVPAVNEKGMPIQSIYKGRVDWKIR